MNPYQLGLIALLAFTVCAGTLWLVLWFNRNNSTAFSNRSETHHIHLKSVPRLGGLGLAAAFIVIFVFFTDFTIDSFVFKIALFSLLMFFLGIWDDFRPLGAKKKLLGQLLIAAVAYSNGIAIHKFQVPFGMQIWDLGEWSLAATILWMVGLTNLINLIDGVDGLAGGICLMLMFLMVFIGQQTQVAIISAGMFGALLGFLKFNFPPARIYLGDGGAYFMGFLISCLTIMSCQKGSIFAALTAPLFVLALPIVDTSLAILRRGLNGLPLFRPDRRHIHHRMLGMGMSRRQLVLLTYGFTAFFLAIGFVAFWFRGQYFAVLMGISALAVLSVAWTLRFSRHWFAISRVVGNSLEVRAQIQYALAQSRWLAMEGSRTPSMTSLGEDAVFIARKLGFSSVEIQLEDDLRRWHLGICSPAEEHYFKYQLPGHRYCFIKFGIKAPENLKNSYDNIPKEFCMMSELVAEGWAKAVATWKVQRQMPLRFELPPAPAAQPTSDLTPPQPAARPS